MAHSRVPATDSYQLEPRTSSYSDTTQPVMMLGLCAFWRACSGDCHLPQVVETTGPETASQSALV